MRCSPCAAMRERVPSAGRRVRVPRRAGVIPYLIGTDEHTTRFDRASGWLKPTARPMPLFSAERSTRQARPGANGFQPGCPQLLGMASTYILYPGLPNRNTVAKVNRENSDGRAT